MALEHYPMTDEFNSMLSVGNLVRTIKNGVWAYEPALFLCFFLLNYIFNFNVKFCSCLPGVHWNLHGRDGAEDLCSGSILLLSARLEHLWWGYSLFESDGVGAFQCGGSVCPPLVQTGKFWLGNRHRKIHWIGQWGLPHAQYMRNVILNPLTEAEHLNGFTETSAIFVITHAHISKGLRN